MEKELEVATLLNDEGLNSDTSEPSRESNSKNTSNSEEINFLITTSDVVLSSDGRTYLRDPRENKGIVDSTVEITKQVVDKIKVSHQISLLIQALVAAEKETVERIGSNDFYIDEADLDLSVNANGEFGIMVCNGSLSMTKGIRVHIKRKS